VAQAALVIVLRRLSGIDDITIGAPIAGRTQSVTEPLVGMFVNTLVLRTTVGPQWDVDALLGDIRATDVAAFAHAHIP
ncbi:hypothetical protein KC221_30585, partial [Mycobacterium tuberculosis]|nr:hypothetical protein [Mycobacterium tuberculosis]